MLMQSRSILFIENDENKRLMILVINFTIYLIMIVINCTNLDLESTSIELDYREARSSWHGKEAMDCFGKLLLA